MKLPYGSTQGAKEVFRSQQAGRVVCHMLLAYTYACMLLASEFSPIIIVASVAMFCLGVLFEFFMWYAEQVIVAGLGWIEAKDWGPKK